MKLLSKKSILDCSNDEIDIHNLEITNFLESLKSYPNYECAGIIKYFDEANKDKEPIIKSCDLHNCDEIIYCVDNKNGVDLALVEGFITFIIYGQCYMFKEKMYITKCGIQIRPYDKNRNFIYLNL